MSNSIIHGSGRAPSSGPTRSLLASKSDLEDRRDQLSAIKRNISMPSQSPSSSPSPVAVRLKKQYLPPETHKKRVVASADIDLRSINESFRNKDGNSGKKTAIIAVRHKYDEDNDALAFNCAELTKCLEDGPITFRILVLLGALFMLIGSLMDYNEQKGGSNYYRYSSNGGISPLYFVISLYVWVFSIFIVTLEMKPFHMGISKGHQIILEYMQILRFTWGRGFFYFFSGSLQFSLFTRWNMIAGGTMMVLGMCCIIIGRMASSKLSILVRRIGNKNNLFEKFGKHDRDRDGCFDVHEFRTFVKEMGVNLTDDELVNAFMAIDRNSDRLMTFSDLAKWYTNAKFEMKTDAGVVV